MTGRRVSILSPSAWGLFPRLLFYLLALSAFTVLFLSVLNDRGARTLLAESRESQLDTLAESLKRSVEGYVEDRQTSLVRLAASPTMLGLVQEGAWANSVRTAAALDVMRAALGSDDDMILLADAQGVVRLTTDPRAPSGAGLPPVPVAERGVATRGVTTADPDGRYTIHLGAPIGNAGTLVLRLSPTYLWNAIGGIRPGKTGYSVLVDAQGRVIGHSSDPSLLYTQFAQPTTADPSSSSITDMPMDLLMGAATQGPGVATRQIEGTGWQVFVVQPDAEAFQPLEVLRSAARNTSIMLFLLATVVAAVLAWSIAKPIRRMRSVLAAAAEGDLTERVNIQTRDELGQLASQVDGTLDSLASVVSEAGLAADAASTTSTQVAVASQQQAAAMAQISATIAELSQSAEQVAQSANSAFRVSEQARTSVGTSLEGLERIKGSTDGLGQRLSDLSTVSQRIGDVADVIGDITNKTHLLSVNAAIEAATAGEHGRRFSVVAQQVKQLADDTRDAATEVKQLIRQTQAAAEAALEASRGVISEVGSGVQIARQTDASIGEMVHQVRTISLATQQQLNANRQVAEAVTNTSEAVNEVASAVRDLELRIEALRARLDQVSSPGAAVQTEPLTYVAPVEDEPMGPRALPAA
jgi:methyl-accepting chemotaxis protein